MIIRRLPCCILRFHVYCVAAAALIGITAVVCPAREYGPDNLPPFVHPPILSPVPDGIKLDVPTQLGNRELARLGFVDVTAAPFAADPTGKKDATSALQQAIDFARDAQMVCFFPPGTYTVSDTLVLQHGVYLRSHLKTFVNFDNMPCVLAGSRLTDPAGGLTRPRIVLKERSPGFNDVNNRKCVIEHRIYEVDGFTIGKNEAGGSGMLMNTMVINLDIVIGQGNAGAVGMHIRSCEGSAVQDVTIDATHGHTGLWGAAGNGGGWANITVIGGRIGLDMRGWTPPTPIMTGVTLVNQTETAIRAACRGSLTAVGLKIVSAGAGPVIVAEQQGHPFNGGVNLVDSEIVYNRPASGKSAVTAIQSEASLYLNNVYVKGADMIAEGRTGLRDGWLHVQEYALGRSATHKQYSLSRPVYIDGRKSAGPFSVAAAATGPPQDLQSRHLWTSEFPHWESGSAVNVKSSPYNAKGDGLTDDTAAIQAAIDKNRTIFFPKGYYRVSRTVRLKPDTRLIGVAQHLSVIMARDPDKSFGLAGNPEPLIETADDGNADTVIAFLGIQFPLETTGGFSGQALPVYGLKWSCGGTSFFRSNDTNGLRVFGFKGSRAHASPPLRHPSVLLTGHGGGKWYNFHAFQFFTATLPEQRAILMSDLTGPLHFYGFEPQGGEGAAVAEVIRGNRISFYGCKSECDTTFLRVANSDHIRVFGHGGIGNPSAGGALYVFENTPNFLVANLTDQALLEATRTYYKGKSVKRNIMEFSPLRQTGPAGRQITVPPLERPVLYRSGNP